MSTQKIGRVKSGKTRREIEVFWDPSSKEVYIGWGGRIRIGKADSAGAAMNIAEAWLYNK